MSPASKLPPYNNVPGAGELVGFPPFTFSGVVLRVFPFQANAGKLQRFVNRCFNDIVPDEIAYYRIALPYVYALMVSYEEMSLQASHGNWISQYEITMSVALERYRRIRGQLVFQDWTWFSPYILVSEELSHMTGREVYGWPKELAELGQRESYWERHPRNARNLLRLSTRAVAFDEGRPSFRHQPLIDIDQVAPTSFLQIRPRAEEMMQVPIQLSRSAGGALARSMDLGAFMAETWGAGAIGMEVDGAIPPSFPPAALFRDLMRRPTNSTTTLKQFRDEVRPHCACYQAIVSAPLGLQRLRNVGLLGEANVMWGDSSGGYRVRLFNDLTHPIGDNLGLIGNEDMAPRRDQGGRHYADLVPVLPFWVEADLNYGRGSVMAWRDPRNEWRMERGERTWLFRNRKGRGDGPEFNESLGGAPERLLSRLRPDPKANDLKSFRPKKLSPEDQLETPDFRFQRATYLVFGFEADLKDQEKTCEEYLAYSIEVDAVANIDWKMKPVALPKELRRDRTESENGDDTTEPEKGMVFLLFGVIEQHGGRPTLGGESWRIFDVQVGFPARFTKVNRKDGTPAPDGSSDPDDRNYFVVPYQFTDQELAGIVARELYGWPMVTANIDVSDTAWLDAGVSGYSVRYKAQHRENAFFQVAVDGPEGRPIKIVEMLLEPPLKNPLKKRNGGGGSQKAIEEEYVQELIALIKTARKGSNPKPARRKPQRKGAVKPGDWSPDDFTKQVSELMSRYVTAVEKTTQQQSGIEHLKDSDLSPVLDLLQKRRQDIDALVREAFPEERDKQEILDALQQLEGELWEIHPAAKFASLFMNQAASSWKVPVAQNRDKQKLWRWKPVSIQRIGLKQFRAADYDPSVDEKAMACYQAVLETPIELDDWSETRSGFRRRPHFQWFQAGLSNTVVRFHRGGWAGNLVKKLGLKSDARNEEEDFGYSEPVRLFEPFFMSGQLKIYRSHRLQWRTGMDWQNQEAPHGRDTRIAFHSSTE
jgi:hypothetical protein